MKPKIFPKPRIGKNKFEEILKKDKYIKEKEIALLSVPGKGIFDVSLKRKKGSLKQDAAKIEKLLNQNFLDNKKRGLKNNINRSQLLHTHIIKRNTKKEEFGIALPSKTDIKSLIKNNKIASNKSEIISVIDSKTGNPIGYTTLKFTRIKITPENFEKILDKYLTLKNIKNARYKIFIFKLLPKIGIDIYFTPETGYRLDKNFNFIPEKK